MMIIRVKTAFRHARKHQFSYHISMGRHCELCSKTDKKSASRSHSNIATLRRQCVNLQTKRVSGKRMRVCTRCIRTMSTRMAQA